MSVTRSKEWRFLQGVRDRKTGSLIVDVSYGDDESGVCLKWFADGDWLSDWCEDDGDSEPDLDHPATQGAVIFGILEPLGISIVMNHGLTSDGSETDYSIRTRWDVKLDLVGLPAAYRTRGEAIRAVFAALDSEGA